MTWNNYHKVKIFKGWSILVFCLPGKKGSCDHLRRLSLNLLFTPANE